MPSFPPPPLRSVASGLVLLAAVVCMGACGGAEAPAAPPRPEPREVDLRPTPAAATEVVERFVIADDLGAWTIHAPAESVVAIPAEGSAGGEPERALRLTARGEDESIRLSRRGSYDLSTFDELRVDLVSLGDARMSVRFGRGDAILATSRPAVFPEGKQRHTLRFSWPALVGDDQTAGIMALRCEGEGREIDLITISLVRSSGHGGLPGPDDAPELVGEGDLRRGVSLGEGKPARMQWDHAAGERVAFSLGRPDDPYVPDGSLVVTISGHGGEPLRWDLPLPGAGAWRHVDLDPGDVAGALTAVLELESEDPRPTAALVSRPVVYTPDDASPTVILLTLDTHRGDHVGNAGRGVHILTPTLDALGAQGVVYRDCFAPTNSTNPSHVALMTGVHPRDTGVIDNRTPLREAAPTLAEVFRDAGWATAATISTRHLGPGYGGLDQGFERFDTTRHTRDAADTVAAALTALDDHRGRPLFLWVHLFDAHTPYTPPADLEGLYAGEGDPFDPSLPEPPLSAESLADVGLEGLRDLDHGQALYKAEITGLDRELERLLAHPSVADAVLGVVADHGEALGEGGTWFAHAGLNTSVVHVPLMLRGPGVPAGQVVDRPVTHLDLGATLLRLAGVDAPGHPGGDLLEDMTSTRAPPRFLLGANAKVAGVAHDGFLLLLHLTALGNARSAATHEAHETQLFDLSSDWACAHDLAAEQPERTSTLRRRLIAWLSAVEDRGWGGEAITDRAIVAQLEALGYTGTTDVGADLWVPDDCEWCRRYP